MRRGSDGGAPARRSWLLLVGGVALAVTLIGIPAAALLGVPVAALTEALVGPLRILLLTLLLLTTPLIVAIAALTDLLGPILPTGLELPPITLPNLQGDPADVSATPTIVFFTVLAVLLIVELAAVGLYLWYRMRERRLAAAEELVGFEERSIVRPDDGPPVPLPAPSTPRGPTDPSTPVGAYLDALELLSRDPSLARAASESPAGHARRVRPQLASGVLGRLAADYQLDRYAGVAITPAERRRLPRRLADLRRYLRQLG